MHKHENRQLYNALMQGTAFGLLAASVTCICLSVIMTFIDMPKTALCVACAAELSAASYICAYCSTQIYRHRGLIQGLISGAAFAAPIFLISTISCGYVSDYCLVKICFCMAFGIIGGIKGINTKQTKAK